MKKRTTDTDPTLNPNSDSIDYTDDPLNPNPNGDSKGLFNKNGFLILEVGHGQDKPVIGFFKELPFLRFVRGLKDHKDIVRCLVFQYYEE